MTRSRLQALLLAARPASVAAQRLRLRRLRAAAARWHRRRRQPDDGHRDVPRRPRPGAASRRSRSTTSASARSPTSQLDGYARRGRRSSSATTPSCPTTRSPRSARPACSARSSSRSSRRPRPAPAASRSSNGDVIPLDRTGRNPEVEEVLGALSLLLNGGGVAQLKTITSELNKALEGREDSARSVLHQIEQLMGQLDEQQGRHRRRDRVAQPARRLGPSSRADIDAALEELPSALRLDRRAARRPGQDAARRSTGSATSGSG